ncbi:MAG: glycoside hydrolase family 2 TIM barrel-domain containing protein, partial [bacterium]|nr:glycoside hydrolase family 2 TIM barrel-domain containing protein [bacterium]
MQRHCKLNLLLHIILIFLAAVTGELFCSTVKVVQHNDGQWQLLVDDQPYIIKGVCYNFWVIGDDPDAGTLRDWSILDLNGNGKNDVAYDSWVDTNQNNIQDQDEKVIGDWQLLKEMGCNTIRVYQTPTDNKRVIGLADKLTFGHPPNKKLLRDLYERFGIRVIIGHFFGEWAIGSGATWDKGTDYSDPKQRENLLECIKIMVNEHKNEPYTLLWMIGNENFNPLDHDNAEKNVPAFLSLVNEVAELIHSLDPTHPVALCNYGQRNLTEIKEFA